MKIEFLSQQTDLLLVGASRSKFWIEILLVFHWHVIGFCFYLDLVYSLLFVMLCYEVLDCLTNSYHCTISENIQDQC